MGGTQVALAHLPRGLPVFAEVKPVGIAQIEAARERIKDLSLITPLVGCDIGAPGKTIRLKLENLQPIGSFKIRPIANAVLSKNRAELNAGIYTTSSGNSALGVAWMARRLGISATAVVPANAPEAKLEKLRRLGTRIDMRPNDVWSKPRANIVLHQRWARLRSRPLPLPRYGMPSSAWTATGGL